VPSKSPVSDRALAKTVAASESLADELLADELLAREELSIPAGPELLVPTPLLVPPPPETPVPPALSGGGGWGEAVKDKNAVPPLPVVTPCTLIEFPATTNRLSAATPPTAPSNSTAGPTTASPSAPGLAASTVPSNVTLVPLATVVITAELSKVTGPS